MTDPLADVLPCKWEPTARPGFRCGACATCDALPAVRAYVATIEARAAAAEAKVARVEAVLGAWAADEVGGITSSELVYDLRAALADPEVTSDRS